MSNKIVGITIGLKSTNESLWVNGIKLNAAMLYMAINKIEGYEAVLIDTSANIEDLSKITFWDTLKFKTIKLKDAKSIDVMIELGTSFTDESFNNLLKSGLNPNVKVVKYHCGNNYVIEMERIIFGDSENGEMPWCTHQDQTWYVPQQHKHNHDYYSIISGKMAIPVPFVWDPYFLDYEKDYIEKNNDALVEYQPSKKLKRIISFEPNMNVLKYSMPLILLAEHALRIGADFESYTVGSGQRMFKNKAFIEVLKKLDIFKAKKINYIGRHPIVNILTTNTDFVISHQWDNPLNYLYLDVMHLGYPLIHNADMIQDAGYFYRDFNIKQGSELLKNALQTHDSNLEEYRIKNQKVLDRYTINNQELLDLYKKLLDGLFEPNSHGLSYEYNWKTNCYK